MANSQAIQDFPGRSIWSFARVKSARIAIEVDTSLPGGRVVRVLEQLRQEHGGPERIQVDNRPEFISQVMDQWAQEHGVALHFIRPGKPTDNGRIERFNGKCRDECLNQFWFVNLMEARERIEAWRIDYNQVRPHSSLSYQTPEEFAAKMAAAPGCGKGQAHPGMSRHFPRGES